MQCRNSQLSNVANKINSEVSIWSTNFAPPPHCATDGIQQKRLNHLQNSDFFFPRKVCIRQPEFSSTRSQRWDYNQHVIKMYGVLLPHTDVLFINVFIHATSGRKIWPFLLPSCPLKKPLSGSVLDFWALLAEQVSRP